MKIITRYRIWQRFRHIPKFTELKVFGTASHGFDTYYKVEYKGRWFWVKRFDTLSVHEEKTK